jgi:hypothetical protein
LFGGNIKVHFAGAEQIDYTLVLYEAGVKYFLWTVFPFIGDRFNLDPFPITVKSLFPPRVLEKVSRHTIMDSGLFTLMFGARAGKRDKPYLLAWQDALISFVIDHKLESTCVEVDCQKVLGPDEAWELRYRMKDKLPNRQIHVFHLEDKQKGLDRMIEFSDYIAISVPELRIAKGKTHKEDVYRLAYYIKNRKPEIDIHLLGCTEKSLLNRCRFCSSSDSTSWQGVNRFGSIMGYATRHVKKEALYEEAIPAIKKVLYYCHTELTQKRLDYYGNYYLAGLLHKKMYEQCAGGQDSGELSMRK